MKKLFSALILTLSCGRAAAKSFWSNLPADFGDIIREAYPIGNGRLAALPNGEPGAEALNLNLDSLWTGGPFESESYAGGNPSEEVYSFLPGIREWIFQNATGNVSKLLHDYENYGSYSVLANLTIAIANITGSTGYMRSLDLTTGIHTTNYTGSDGKFYATTSYCSYPDQVCVYNLSCNSTLPDISIGFQNLLVDETIQILTCGDNYVRIAGNLQAGPPLGMRYDAIARLVSSETISVCNGTENGTMVVPSSAGLQSISIVIGAGSNYDQKKGNSASNYSFQGDDPGDSVELVTSAAAQNLESDLRGAHIEDYSSLTGSFSLDLPDTKGSAQWRTDLLISQYTVIDQDPYLESLMFEFGRHLFISSSRENSLPANLQGKWNYQSDPAWSADYHANINIQMNYWFADQLGLANLTRGLWDYIEDTWVPRGSETAQLLYGAPGWVVHNEMNIFGHTGMKNGSQWADYPAAAAWLMQHIWDHYEYSGNETWFQIQGYPMIKGVAEFWLSQLQPDSYFDDGTLVVNPCNSPEHGVTTFGCTHFQQLIYQVFSYLIKAEPFIPDSDTEFLANITTALQSLDKGLHIGTWNEIKEWKIPDTYGYDFQNDTHRHLSNLYGWYPGYSISSYASGYTDPAIQSAVANTLYSRGIGGDVINGQASQTNAGWQKVWRAACWARLNNTERAYFELRFTIMSNFVENGLSMYSGHDEPFQIDANFGYVGAVLSMLVVDLPSLEDGKRIVVLGPAIPAAWAGGSVRGLRLRGGGVVSFSWDDDGVVDSILDVQNTKGVVLVNVKGELLYDSLE